ncbi:hypothetical protein [Scytonema sp. PCC 10023]|uniref:hypothetical protein n=1 Tax=Scytonema sp. PCC 10023 TaxID=1680591 RepID=UPI0039C7390A
MNKRSHIHKKADSSASNPVLSQLQSRPFIAQAQPQSQKPLLQKETENQEFQQHNFEATRLKLQAKHGTITSEGQEQLTVLQAKMSGTLHRKLEHASRFGRNFASIPYISRNVSSASTAIIQKRASKEPDDLKEGMEIVTGHPMDDVKVNYNSSEPDKVNALATTQRTTEGIEIHLKSGQEKHLPHELGHAAQQMEGEVKPTIDINGVSINDDKNLEREADVMGTKALQMKRTLAGSMADRERRGTPPPCALPQQAGKGTAKKEVVQRITFAQEADLNINKEGEVEKGKYVERYFRVPKNNEGEEESLPNPERDEKMQALHVVAVEVERILAARQKIRPNEHIAVMVTGKKMMLAVNTTQTKIPQQHQLQDSELIDVAYLVLDSIRNQTWYTQPPENRGAENKTQKALRWVARVEKNDITAKGYEVTENKNIHGEMRIFDEILTNPKWEQTLKERQQKAKTRGYENKKRVIRIGGTYNDCADCHEVHHGLIINSTNNFDGPPGELRTVYNPNEHPAGNEMTTNDARLEQYGQRVMSPGFHKMGNKGRYPNWAVKKQDGTLIPSERDPRSLDNVQQSPQQTKEVPSEWKKYYSSLSDQNLNDLLSLSSENLSLPFNDLLSLLELANDPMELDD